MQKRNWNTIGIVVMTLLLFLAGIYRSSEMTSHAQSGYPSTATATAYAATQAAVNLCASCPAGTYAVYGYNIVTTTSSGQTASTVIGWTDEAQAETATIASISTTSKAQNNGIQYIHLAAAGAITATFSLTGGTAAVNGMAHLDRLF